jgi:hypothetical protein
VDRLAVAMTLLVSHIPKTAGTSLKLLVQRFHPEAAFAYRGELTLGDPDIEFLRRFRQATRPPVMMGHFSYGVHRLLDVAPVYATLLREPIARVVSVYRYQRTLPNSRFAALFGAGMSLRTFVSAGITERTNNHMCRVLAGIPPEAGLVIGERWLLDLALHNLRRHFVVIGTAEKFERFVADLAQRLNWGAYEIPRENVTAGPALDLDPPTRAAIIDKNALDIALFEHVYQRYG